MQNLGFGIYGSDNGAAPVTLVDKMGVLDDLYQAADLAFVGGTLVNVGGHNILEPVWAGTPVLFGPHICNILESKDYVLNHNYGAMVNTAEEMSELVTGFMNNKSLFAIKSREDLLHSPTAMAGEYILEKLAHA
jgi:3-deoxy-D-manno-octulosonic-acid transferase